MEPLPPCKGNERLPKQHRKSFPPYISPSVPTLRHICRALGITISQFYGTDGLTVTVTEQQKGFLEMFNRLSPGDKQKVEGYIEGLLAKDGESGL